MKGDFYYSGGATVQNSEISYCKKEVMSMCTAEGKTQQRTCQFYERSNLSERCMYFVFDQYCDSLPAQQKAVED